MARGNVRPGGILGLRAGASPTRLVALPNAIAARKVISNYAADAGRGSDKLSISDTCRSALLGSVAAGALFFGYGRSARAGPDPCTVDVPGVEVTCSGDQSAGIASGADFPSSYTTLNVNALTDDITPASGVDGINFTSGGNITINSDTGPFSIVTTGAGADGIFAYSNGGGTVNVDHTGDIVATAGATDDAHAIVAKSASIFTAAGSVTVDSSGDFAVSAFRAIGIQALGYSRYANVGEVSLSNAAAIEATSNGPYGVAIAIQAGNRTFYGNADSVTIKNTGDLTATSTGLYNYALGIQGYNFAGGGTGQGLDIQNSGDIKVTANGPYGGAFALGGFVDGGGDFTINNAGNLTSNGFVTGGISASAFGNYGASSAITVTNEGTILSTAAGRQALGIVANSRSHYNDAGPVTVINTGYILASSASRSAIGIYASSSSYFGDSGIVMVSSTGDVLATATSMPVNRVAGIYARSISQNGFADSVTIEVTGDVTAAAPANSIGIFAESFGALGNGYVSITVEGNTSGETAGVQIANGASNSLLNYGTIQSAGTAVLSGTGDETVDNYGTVTGNVDLGSGANAFLNRAGGVFNTSATAAIGAGNTLTNAGDLSPGGVGALQTTALTGNLVQTGTGTFTVNLSGAASDRINVSAGTATLEGTVLPYLLSLPTVSQFTIMSTLAPGDMIDDGITVQDSLAFDYELLFLNDQDLILTIAGVNFAVSGLNPNQTSTANYLNNIFAAGGGAQSDILAALGNVQSLSELAAALDRLHPEHYLAQVNDTLHASLFFLSSIMSCPTADGAYAIIAEDQCVWAKVGGRTFDQDRTWTNIGGDIEAWSISAGAQVALQGNWRLGFAGSYEQTNLSTNNFASSDGERAEGGVVVKNRWGATTLAAAAFGGYGWFDTTRTIALAGIGAAVGEQEVAFGGVHTRLSHLLAQSGGWYVKPLVDLNATYIDYGGLSETGGGAAALFIQGNDDWVLSASPALEVGGDFKMSDGMTVRPFVRTGVTLFNDAEFTLTSSFLSAPAGVAPFTIASEFDEVFLDVAAGVDVLSAGGVEVKLNYDGRFSEDSESHAGGAKVGMKF